MIADDSVKKATERLIEASRAIIAQIQILSLKMVVKGPSGGFELSSSADSEPRPES